MLFSDVRGMDLQSLTFSSRNPAHILTRFVMQCCFDHKSVTCESFLVILSENSFIFYCLAMYEESTGNYRLRAERFSR